MPKTEVFSPSGIVFTKPLLRELERQYELAIQRHETVFKFRKHELLVSYAKYLIEYLNTIFV